MFGIVLLGAGPLECRIYLICGLYNFVCSSIMENNNNTEKNVLDDVGLASGVLETAELHVQPLKARLINLTE